MGKEMLKQADDWLKIMFEIASEQKEAETIEHMKQRIKVQKWLMEQAKRVQELERKNQELEYASKYNGELNEFLQKRKLPPSTLGRHVVDVVMDYVEELEETNKRNYWIGNDLKLENLKLEQQNKRYREIFQKILDSTMTIKDYKTHSYHAERLARKALEGESSETD